MLCEVEKKDSMRAFVCAVVLASLSVPCFSQTNQKIEVFGGFSYLNYEAISTSLPNGTITFGSSGSSSGILPTVNFTPHMSLYGWNGSVTADLTPRFAFTTDVGGDYSNTTESATGTLTEIDTDCPGTCTTTATYQISVSNPRVHTFLFGPQFAFRMGRVKGYGHYLMGGLVLKMTEEESANSIGDIIVNPAPVVNPRSIGMFAMAFGGGVDYPLRRNMRWRVGADYLTSTGAAQNHFRVVTGPVWTFGK